MCSSGAPLPVIRVVGCGQELSRGDEDRKLQVSPDGRATTDTNVAEGRWNGAS